MKKKSQNGLYVAFDIGTVSIKAAVIEVSEKGRRLATIEEELLKPLSAYPGEDEYRLQLTEALKNLASRLPMQQCQSVSALYANREMQVKIIELPGQVMPEQLDKLLNWEAKKLLSPTFREEPYSFAYKVLRKNPYTIALAVIPQRLLERFSELFTNAGIELDGAFGELFSAHSLKEIVDISGLPAMSIVNFGHSGTHLQIFSAGEMKFYRFIPSGMSEMSDPPKENELEMYSQKIRFSFDYFRAVSKLTQIDNLYFMGGGAAQPGVLPFERNYFNPTRVNIVDISSGIDISPILPELTNNQPAEDRQRRLLPYIPAVGACLASLSEDANTMSLTARLRDKKREERLARLAGMLPVWLGIGGLIVVVFALLLLKNNMQAELAQINSQLDFARMNTEAAKLKLSKHKAVADTGVKLSPPAKKALAPVLNSRMAVAESLFHVFSLKPEGLAIEEILVRSALEAESISLPGLDNESPAAAGESEEAPKSNFTSGLSEASGDEQQFREGLRGEVLIIRGSVTDNEILGSYLEGLTRKKAIIRCKSISSRKAPGDGIEFLLKGELP